MIELLLFNAWNDRIRVIVLTSPALKRHLKRLLKRHLRLTGIFYIKTIIYLCIKLYAVVYIIYISEFIY